MLIDLRDGGANRHFKVYRYPLFWCVFSSIGTPLRRIFPVLCSLTDIGNLDGKGSCEGDLQEKTKGNKDMLWKPKDECEMSVIGRFDQVTRGVKAEG